MQSALLEFSVRVIIYRPAGTAKGGLVTLQRNSVFYSTPPEPPLGASALKYTGANAM